MPKIELSQGEINSYSNDIYKILSDIPLFYLIEIVENAMEGRKRDGEDPDLDISDSEDEADCPESSESSTEEEDD